MSVSGAKNAVLPIMAACLLADEESVIEGVPRVADVLIMAEILRQLGVTVLLQGERLTIRPAGYRGFLAPYEFVSAMRASVCVLGPLLAKQGQAKVAMPGGCVIGPRPIDLHLKGLSALGGAFAIEQGYVVASTQGLHGAKIHLGGSHGSSVLATANVMTAATLARGLTVIEHAACEPEVVDLANALMAMGARIEGHGSSVIRIDGVPRLRGAHHRIIRDRVEAGTFMIAAAISGGDLTVEGACPDHLGAVIDKLSEAGVTMEQLNGAVRVQATEPLRSVDVTTLSFPGFPTDLQAPMMALMATARGVSVVTDTIYPERFMHVEELNRMGANITREGSSAIVKGVERLSGAPVRGADLRASAALALAGLIAAPRTEVGGLEHLDRGYEGLEQKLVGVGAKVRRVTTEAA